MSATCVSLIAMPVCQALVCWQQGVGELSGLLSIDLYATDEDATAALEQRLSSGNLLTPLPALVQQWLEHDDAASLPDADSWLVHGSDFQRQVWKAICAIPAGEVRSYSQLAAMIGRPAAVRAVATACARNTLALLVPCHRVVPASGGVGQYRWGSALKERLLRYETGLKAL